MLSSTSRRLPERTHDDFGRPPGEMASRQVASAAQWLARFAHSWLPHEPGNRHLLMKLDGARGVLVTAPVVDGLALELTLADLSLQLLEKGTPSPHRMDIQDRTPAHIEAWLLVELLHRAIERERFSKALPWSTAKLMNGDSEEFTPELLKDELAAIARGFGLAQQVLAALANVAAADIPCSADNLHLAVAMDSKDPAGGTLVAGLSPGDGVTPQPFFYVARALPRPGTSAELLPAVITLGEIEHRGLGATQVAEIIMRAAETAASGSKAAE